MRDRARVGGEQERVIAWPKAGVVPDGGDDGEQALGDLGRSLRPGSGHRAVPVELAVEAVAARLDKKTFH
jgi:hypothetical protein